MQPFVLPVRAVLTINEELPVGRGDLNLGRARL